VLKTQQRIREWVNYYGLENVAISFSGSKDSTVLLYIARQIYPNIEAIFVNTGLEYPEIQKFVKTFDNVTIIRPKMMFADVIKKYGYLIVGKEISRRISDGKETLMGQV
jgi:3''-phosphoadenosine 5''-phosphosulfate sulfotransferase (PAPS reductase)/FAD synthetase and related enzymes